MKSRSCFPMTILNSSSRYGCKALAGRHVIIVEDIIDTGLSMQHILQQVHAQNPASVKVITLLFKREALKVPIQPDYVGFEIPRKFVLGYGLDYDGLGRNLPDIYAESLN